MALLAIGPLAGCAASVVAPATAWPRATPPGAMSPDTAPRSAADPSLEPAASATASDTPPNGLPAQLVDAGPRGGDRVALTFHLASVMGRAPEIMAWLTDNQVPATIFVSGGAVARPDSDEGRAVIDILDRSPDLFELGSHGFAAEDFTALTAAQIEEELRRTEAVLAPLTSQDPRPLFAPPAGAWSDPVLVAAGAAGYRYAIRWDVDPVDWKPVAAGGPTAEEIARKVLEGVQPGSIVLLQLGGTETLDALSELVASLRERFRLVRVSELLRVGPVD